MQNKIRTLKVKIDNETNIMAAIDDIINIAGQFKYNGYLNEKLNKMVGEVFTELKDSIIKEEQENGKDKRFGEVKNLFGQKLRYVTENNMQYVCLKEFLAMFEPMTSEAFGKALNEYTCAVYNVLCTALYNEEQASKFVSNN